MTAACKCGREILPLGIVRLFVCRGGLPGGDYQSACFSKLAAAWPRQRTFI